MKTTFTISLEKASEAYDAITDNRLLEENLINDYPNIWIVEAENPTKQIELVEELINQLALFGILLGQYEVTNE